MGGCIGKKGSTYYPIVYLPNNKRKWYPGFSTKREASVKLNEILYQTGAPLSNKILMSDLIEKYDSIFLQVSVKQSTRNQYLKIFKNFINNTGDFYIDNYTTLALDQYFASMLKNHKFKYIKHLRIVLHRLFEKVLFLGTIFNLILCLNLNVVKAFKRTTQEQKCSPMKNFRHL